MCCGTWPRENSGPGIETTSRGHGCRASWLLGTFRVLGIRAIRVHLTENPTATQTSRSLQFTAGHQSVGTERGVGFQFPVQRHHQQPPIQDRIDAKRIEISYIPHAEPWNNGSIESFNNRIRDECLQLNQWRNLLEARIGIGDWQAHYSHHHRHSNLNYLTPCNPAGLPRICTPIPNNPTPGNNNGVKPHAKSCTLHKILDR